jgi:hypothetical protein
MKMTKPDPSWAPTAEEVFGPEPWYADVTVSGPHGSNPCNPYYYATEKTAAIVAQMINGVVVPDYMVKGWFRQSRPNLMVQIFDGRLFNAGQIAHLFTHGYPVSYIETQLRKDLDEDQALGSMMVFELRLPVKE